MTDQDVGLPQLVHDLLSLETLAFGYDQRSYPETDYGR